MGAATRDPVSRFTVDLAIDDTDGFASVAARPGRPRPRCYHRRMLDELDALAAKLAELSARMQQLRAENLDLRTQLGAAQSELGVLRGRVAVATQRLDAMLAALPTDEAAGTTAHDAAGV